MAEYIKKALVAREISKLLRVRESAVDIFQAGFEYGVNRAWIKINKIPAADVAPVVHGKWKATGTFKVADYNYIVVEQRCSACGHCSIRFKNKAESNYCPKCGAKMDEEEHDNNV